MISSSLVSLLAVISCVHSYDLTQPASLTVRPDATLTIDCKVSYSVTRYRTAWIRQPAGKALEWIGLIWGDGDLDYKDSLKSKFSITRDTSSNTITLQGKNMQAQDTAVYYCARYTGLDYAFDYWGKGTMVTVSSAQDSAPKSIFALSQCSADSDDFLTVGCLTRGFSPADSLTFNWKDGNDKERSDFVQYPAFGRDGDYTKFSHLRVKKSDWDSKKPYICEASNSKGRLDTKIAPPAPPPDQPATVYLTVPTQTELENGTATFMCLARKFSPKTYSFKWFQDGQEVKNVIDAYETSEKIGSVTLYSATSILQITAETWQKPNTKIKCEFVHKTGEESREAEYTAHHQQDCSNVPGEIVPPSLEDMLRNRTGVLKCKASGAAGFMKIEIRANTFVIKNKSNFTNEEKVELDVPIGYEEWSNGTVFTCTVEHECLPQPREFTFRRENGEGRMRPSVYLLAPPEHKDVETMTLTCYVKDFYPKEVFVSWLADDEPANLMYKPKTSQPMQNDKYFSVYSQITVSYSDWKSGTVYSCVVYHESIDKKMRVLTRSIADNNEKSGVFNLSMNTPACCKE